MRIIRLKSKSVGTHPVLNHHGVNSPAELWPPGSLVGLLRVEKPVVASFASKLSKVYQALSWSSLLQCSLQGLVSNQEGFHVFLLCKSAAFRVKKQIC